MGGDSASRERELKRMGKAELVRLALSLESQMQAMEERVLTVEKQLRDSVEDRKIEITEAGSIAEAAIRVTDVFEEAQRAADTYLFNIREMEEQQRREYDKRIREAEIEAEKTLKEAEKSAKKVISDAQRQADDIVAGAKADGQKIRREADLEAAKRERDADKYYENIKERTRSALVNLSRFNEDYERLKKIAGGQPDEGMLIIANESSNAKSDVGATDGGIDPQKLYKSVDSLIDSKQQAS